MDAHLLLSYGYALIAGAAISCALYWALSALLAWWLAIIVGSLIQYVGVRTVEAVTLGGVTRHIESVATHTLRGLSALRARFA